MKRSKPATAAEKRHLARVASLGCLVCQRPSQVHHLTVVSPRDHMLTIPLCADHHTGAFSIHKSKEQFLRLHGSEWKLLADTNRKLA